VQLGDIFREIDEELRQERLEKLWKDYGKYAIAGAVVLVLGVAAFRGWQEYRGKQREAESAQFMAAASLMAENKDKEAEALFAALATKADDTYGALARFEQAALKAKAGDAAGAIALYDALAKDGGLSQPLRDVALLQVVMHAMDRPDADAKALSARLEPLIANRGPWRSSASELAGLLALRSGDTAKARERFKSIADDGDAPANVRARATEILAVIGS
jgi:hypothetical protein